MNITTIEELKKIGEGEIVELSPFNNGSKLIVKLRQPDITMMLIDNKIPNPLIETALKLINGNKDELKNDIKNSDNENGEDEDVDFEKTQKYFQAMSAIAKFCLISPTYIEIEEYAGGLNVTQLLEIFNYAIGGAEGLKSFRKQ